MSIEVKEATCQQALDAIHDSHSVVVDVRCPEEYSIYGKIIGAHTIPLKIISGDDLEDNPDFCRELSATVRTCADGCSSVYFICGSGRRSCDAAECATRTLEDSVCAIYNVRGGMDEWVEHGLPTELD